MELNSGILLLFCLKVTVLQKLQELKQHCATLFSTGNDTAVSAKIPNECEVHSELAGNPNNDMNSCSHTPID